MSEQIRRAIVTLSEEEPTYNELVSLYRDLSATAGETASEEVSARALAHLVGEFIDYLDLVRDDYEKSVGLTRPAERSRILESFTPPSGETEVERVADLGRQWRAVDRFDLEAFFSAR